MKKLTAIILAAAMLALAPVSVFADVIDWVLYTDIRTYIGGVEITSYNIKGNTAVVVEDLKDYGFKVVWDGDTRTLSVARDAEASVAGGEVTRTEGEVGARAIAIRDGELGIDAPVYYSVFDPSIPGWDNPGTFHSSDLWFFFETLAKCWRPFVGKHYDLARQMCNYWCNFIRSGDPNGRDADGKKMPEWRPYTREDPCRMIFGDTAYTEAEGPGELVSFLLKHGMKDR